MTMISKNCYNTPIESLNVSPDCLKSLRESGFIIVGDILDILVQFLGGNVAPLPYAPYLHHLDEIIDQLKMIDCWPEGLQKK